MTEELEQARTDYAAAWTYFDYATGKDVETACYLLKAHEIRLDNLILENLNEKGRTINAPQRKTFAQKLICHFIPKSLKSQRRSA